MSVITRTAAIAALLLAAACSGQPEVLEPDPTASTTSAGTVRPPQRPAAANEDSESGAATFVLYWINTSHYASISGDYGALAEISSKDCISCSNLIKVYKSTVESGGGFSGGEQSLADVTAERSDDGKAILVRAKSTIAEGTFQETRESDPEAVQKEVTRVSYRVERSDGAWQMAEFSVDD